MVHIDMNKCKDCGIKIGKKSERCYSCSKKGSRNPQWVGSLVGYNALHAWVRRNKQKVNVCENCNKKKSYDLSNISGKYLRDLSDWKWVCRTCHMEGDGRLEKMWKGRRKKKDCI